MMFFLSYPRSIRLITYTANHKIGKAQQLAKKKRSGKNSYYGDEDSTHPHTLDDDADLLVCETRDLVKVGLRADVFYSIVDPEKCIQTLNTGKHISHAAKLYSQTQYSQQMAHFSTIRFQTSWKVSGTVSFL